jgi:hypothetical protein
MPPKFCIDYTKAAIMMSFFPSPYLEPMRQASTKAFRVLMENEKDNKEFCEFIAKLQEKRKQGSLENEHKITNTENSLKN